MKLPFFFLLILLYLSSLSHSTTTTTISDDTTALSLFASQTDHHGSLLSNWTLSSTINATTCMTNWLGVNCTNGRVTSISLPSLNLRGPIDSLSSLDQLRFLDLRDNRLNGTLTPITHCLNLKHVYLSGNDFSSEIPPEISSLHRLLRLDLSNNNLQGLIPTELSKLTRLLTLHLQNNALSGKIPDFLNSIPQLKELNLSNNEFSGDVSSNLLQRFGKNSFMGNQGLCGKQPFPQCTSIDATKPSETVPSNPTSLPTTSPIQEPNNHTRKGLSKGAIVAIVVATSFVLLAASFVVAFCCGKSARDSNSMVGSEAGKRRSSYSNEKRVFANNHSGGGGDSDGTTATDRSKLVFYERRKQFELEELLRASAEMLGKGSLGTVYKAILDDGSTVAVKRLKDANPCARKEFEQYMDVVGKLKHQNILKLRAYYYAKEEKLLVYDYMPNGSLHALLHGNRGPGRIPLDWTTRISLVLGAARGLSRIHEEYSTSRIPHGNLKSSNILLDKNGISCISDFGLSLLLNPVHAIARLGGYKAPEQVETKRLSQKADIYSFGVLLLEVLTGKAPSVYSSPSRLRIEEEEESLDLPKWIRSVVKDEWTVQMVQMAGVFDQELLRYKNIEEELVLMLQLAMACVVLQPEKRPTMSEVVKVIEEIRVEQDYDESRDSLSPSVSTNEDVVGV